MKMVDSLDENCLTICFARRFATYKRAHLLFSNLERLAAILKNKDCQCRSSMPVKRTLAERLARTYKKDHRDFKKQ